MKVDLERLYTKQEVADALGVHVNTVDKWIIRGHLRPRYIGRRVMFTRKEYERFIARDHFEAGPQAVKEAHHPTAYAGSTTPTASAAPLPPVPHTSPAASRSTETA